MFDAVSLRKGTQSSLMKMMFEEGVVEKLDMNDGIYVLDGGFLCHGERIVRTVMP